MNIQKAFLLLVAALLPFGMLAPAHARAADVSVSFFYDSLDPYGEWVSVPGYGYAWHPTNVDDNWAPYTDGYWAYTDDGWTWVSYEDYGGIVYHYGRWARIPGEGWVWVPGETWAPAWVSWRCSDDYVGWAPLPPEARWHADFGFSGGWVDAHFDIGPGLYSFVGVRDFGNPALGPVIINRDRNVEVIRNTTNITNITTVNNTTVYNGGPRYETLAARSARPIPTLHLVRQTDAAAIRAQGGKILARQQGNQLIVPAPRITATANGIKPIPAHVARTLTGVKSDTGWSAVSDPSERAQLQSTFKAQAQTAGANSRAHSVSPAELKLVQERIKAKPLATPAGSLSTTQPPTAASKSKVDTTALENTPASEQPGPIPAKTPKAKKGKNGKIKPATESLASHGEKTPSPIEPTPHIKKSKASENGLQPFDEGAAATPKPKHQAKSEEDYVAPKAPKIESERSTEAHAIKAEPTPKGEKHGKSDKDKKKKTDEDQ